MSEELFDIITQALLAHGDPDRAVQQQAYMKSDLPYFGLTAPEFRKIVNPILREHVPVDREAWVATVRYFLHEATHRDHWYAALSVVKLTKARRWRTPEALPLYREIVTTCAWWDIVDDVATHLVRDLLIDPTHRAAMEPVVRQWGCDDNVWLRRTAVICQVGAKAATDAQLLHDMLVANLEDSLHGKAFWIRKGIGWALREYAKTDATWVVDFVAEYEDRLSGLSRREALKHQAP